jgi:hypothetical protein
MPQNKPPDAQKSGGFVFFAPLNHYFLPFIPRISPKVPTDHLKRGPKGAIFLANSPPNAGIPGEQTLS